MSAGCAAGDQPAGPFREFYAALLLTRMLSDRPIGHVDLLTPSPVEIAAGTEDARFRVVRLAADAAPYGRIYFCHHFTRHLVWRDEWRQHANGTIAVTRR